MLGEMLQIVPYFGDYQFIVAGAPSQPIEVYAEILANLGLKNVKIIKDQTYDLLRCARAALVTSGTATLETALLSVPQVVCYKGSLISYYIARRLIRVPFISLVNLIYGEKIVEELIQNDLNIDNLCTSLKHCLENAHTIQHKYELLRGMLGNEGASEKAALAIINAL
jgi:lipid-A-disaccharide synthase